jgi:hypothetical protein
MCCVQEVYLTDKDKHWLMVKGLKKNFQANGPLKQAGIAIHISDKVNTKPKLVRRNKEGHFFVLIKGTIHQEEITVINLYAPNFGTPISLNKHYWTYKCR